MNLDLSSADCPTTDAAIKALGGAQGQPVTRSNEDVAIVLLALARDLLRDTHPAISNMIRYALVEFDDTHG